VSDASRPGLVKITAEITGVDGVEGESFWAESLGDDLYRLDNIPFYAYDVHYQDVVRAVPREPGSLPILVEAVRPSGHKTLRVMFDAELEEADVKRLLEGLTARGVQFEHADGYFYALNVPPEGDYQGICTLLWNQENAGWLKYETGTTPPI
jgi:hypothetical protein